MRAYAGDEQFRAVDEPPTCEEPAGSFEDPADTFRDLFLGFPGEPPEERAARQAVAHEVLAELAELSESGRPGSVDHENAAYAEALSAVSPLWGRGRRGFGFRTPPTKGAA